MPAVPILVGEDITVAYLTQRLDETAKNKYQSVDLTVNNSVVISNSVDLVIPMLASASYIFESCLFYDTASGPDIAISIAYPVNATGLIYNGGSGTAITTAVNPINQQATSLSGTSLVTNYGGVAAGTIMTVWPSGGITTTGAGNLTIGFAQVVATAANTLLKKWSWIRLSRVA
jgi:hypothetical protein